jgi:hypothetical protein
LFALGFLIPQFEKIIHFFFCGCAGRIGSAYIAVKVGGAKDYPLTVTASETKKAAVEKNTFYRGHIWGYSLLVISHQVAPRCQIMDNNVAPGYAKRSTRL